MDPDLAFPSPRTLLEHEPFVRAVARGLLGDAGAAEDVAQETWMRALREGPRERGALRAWLGRVAANLAHDRRRSTTRRALREERAARGEAQESVAVAFERLSIQRDVVAAILELDEPYRGVVLLRYFHELEPQAIAARLGTKPATVRTQLVRAHELLRAKLDSRYGREAWAALLLPTGVAAPDARLGGLPVVALAGSAVAAVAAIWVWSSGGREPSAAPALAAAPVSEASIEPAAPSLPVSGTRSVVSAASATTPPPAADPRAVQETLAPRAELLARSKYDDYEKATFSFELGLRDDPEQIVGNDWDVLYDGKRFRATTVVDDASQLFDLGDVRIGDLWAWRGELTGASEDLPVVQGHTYFLWSRDGNTDLAVAFEVLEVLPEDRCTLEWYATADGRTARASFRDESPGTQLAARLIALRSELRRPGELRVPYVLLQGRLNGSNGNPHRVDIAGEMTYFDALSPAALDPLAPLESDEDLAYCEGGWVPEGKVFVVTRATYWGTAKLDSRPREGFALVIGGQRVAENDREQPLSGTWFGRVEIPPGGEMLTYLELKNSSAGEAELFGEFVERPGLLAQAPPSKPRAPRPPKAKPAPLSEPYARLQGRNGAGGGNPFRVKLDGDVDRFRELAAVPIDLLAPIEISERGVAYCEGGIVPEGQVFVVTRVDYWGVAKGDSNGNGGFAVVVGGQRIVEHADAEPLVGTWHGRIEIPARVERSTFLEIRNSSAGEAILRGVFVPAR